MIENYCTTREAAKLLGVSLRTAQQWLEKGYLKGWKTEGGHRRITRVSVQLMLSGSLRRSGGDPQPALRILIIEDDVSLLKLYRRQISLWPFATVVHTAPNGFEGLLKIGEILPRMLLCDLRLPGVNGFQIVRALCDIERYRNMKIVVVSALPTEEVVAHGGIPERVELMGKPIDFKRLCEVAACLFNEDAALQPRSRLRIY